MDSNIQRRRLVFVTVAQMERCFHPRRPMQMFGPGCSIDYSLHLLCVFKAFFSSYCELLPLLCVVFPIHTQAVSMSHSTCSLLPSKVFLQADSLFMVFSSINNFINIRVETFKLLTGCSSVEFRGSSVSIVINIICWWHRFYSVRNKVGRERNVLKYLGLKQIGGPSTDDPFKAWFPSPTQCGYINMHSMEASCC